MAEISKFFNAQEIAPGVYDREYLASDFAKYFSSVLSAGLLLDENQDYGLQVTHQNNLDITVSVGSALIKGYYYENTTPLTLSHSIPETNNDRIDRIVLRMDLRNQSRYIKAFVKEGTASTNPIPPELQRDEYIYELSLAQVVLRANTASINPSDITDERALEDVCGIVQSLITVPTSVFQQQFDAWFENQKLVYGDEMEEWKDQQQQDFMDWFQSIQDILDGDVAANLATRIANLEDTVTSHLADLASQDEDKGASLVGFSANEMSSTNVREAILETFLLGNSTKEELVDKLLLLDDSLPITHESSWQEVLNSIESISSGGNPYPDGFDLRFSNSVIYSTDDFGNVYLRNSGWYGEVYDYNGNLLKTTTHMNVRGISKHGYTLSNGQAAINIYDINGTLIKDGLAVNNFGGGSDSQVWGGVVLTSNSSSASSPRLYWVYDITTGTLLKEKQFETSTSANIVFFLNKKDNAVLLTKVSSSQNMIRLEKLEKGSLDSVEYRIAHGNQYFMLIDYLNW